MSHRAGQRRQTDASVDLEATTLLDRDQLDVERQLRVGRNNDRNAAIAVGEMGADAKAAATTDAHPLHAIDSPAIVFRSPTTKLITTFRWNTSPDSNSRCSAR